MIELFLISVVAGFLGDSSSSLINFFLLKLAGERKQRTETNNERGTSFG